MPMSLAAKVELQFSEKSPLNIPSKTSFLSSLHISRHFCTLLQLLFWRASTLVAALSQALERTDSP
jgi:hypothetical protein